MDQLRRGIGLEEDIASAVEDRQLWRTHFLSHNRRPNQHLYTESDIINVMHIKKFSNFHLTERDQLTVKLAYRQPTFCFPVTVTLVVCFTSYAHIMNYSTARLLPLPQCSDLEKDSLHWTLYTGLHFQRVLVVSNKSF